MGRGVSSGGGQSSLGYLFGSGEAPKNAQPANSQGANNAQAANTLNKAQAANTPNNAQAANNQGPNNAQAANAAPAQNATVSSPPQPVDKQIPAGIPGNLKNNYHRADGQNCGNFLTDRPSTKVHAAPGGGSSLDYLFGGPPPGNNSSS